MLTTKVITPRQGESYYAKENYYSTEESVDNSRWMGKGAKKLGLKGKVKPKDFKKLLYGQLPNGTTFRTRKNERKGYKERAGLDCTFSAPKSFSLLLLAGGREELENAQQKAVLNTLKIIERDYATTRVCRDGKVRTVNTGNLVVALYDHDTSRELDPHRHTHCVILNMTDHDNRWYSLRNDDIHANKKLLGMIYQNQLAIEVQKLGYEIEPKGHGQFEIKGFTEEQLQSFSKRRQQIKSQLGEESTWKEREKVWDKTRIKKGEPIPREELQAYWRKELEELGVSYPQPNKVKQRGGKDQSLTPETLLTKFAQRGEPPQRNFAQPSTPDVNQAVNEAIEHCSERTVSFKPEDIQKFILAEVGKYEQHELEQAIATSDELIHLDKQVTTQTALLREIATIKLVKQGQGNVKALTNTEIVDEFIEGKNLTEGQRDAIHLASTTSDQIIAWQGKAGVGKTYALNEFKQIAQREGCVVKGFAPSAKAAKVLAEEMGIETTTVARKLVSNSWKDKTERQQIWIVDEAGLLGAKDAHELLQKAEAENARVLLVGDTRQLSSVSAGNPFKSLQQAGIATAYLNQSLRQKTKDLKHAVDLLSDGKIAEGIKVFETNKRILEIKDASKRASHIAQDYLKLTPDERKQTLIIAGTHQERELLIDSIRGGLKEEGSLGEDVTVQRLKSKNLTNVQKKYAHYYEPGNIVIPLSNYKRLGLEKGQQYTVKAVEGDSLVLVDRDDDEKRVSPTWFKHKEIYQAIDTNIAVGDRLRWGKNDKQLKRINGEEFVVTKIDGGTATICNEKGRHEQIDIKEPQHLDHALVSTTYSSQGITSSKVYVSVTNDFTLSQESFYVAASRAKYDLHLYVEDKARLIEKAQTSRSQANPLELIREHQRKEVVTNQTTSTPKYEQEQFNQTIQSNHERTQHPQPNIQRDSDRSSSPSPPKIRRDRNQSQHPSKKSRGQSEQPNRNLGIEPPRLKTRVSQLSDGISGFVEQEETERLTKSVESLNRHLADSLLSTGRTENLRNSIDRLNGAVAKYASHQDRRRGIETLRDYIEESILESDPELINAIEQLSQSLEAQSSSTINNLQQLQETINSYTHKLQQQPTLQNTAEELAQSITDYSEQIEVEELTPSVTNLNTQLQEYVSNHSTTALENLHHSIVKQNIMQNLHKVNPAERDALKLKAESISKKLKQLNTKSKSSKQKQQKYQKDFWSKQLASIQAYTQLSVGQKVAVDEKFGTIAALKLSSGGMPEAWVHWDNHSVPIPEQPSRLAIISQQLNQNQLEQHESIQKSQQSESINTTNNSENIGRRSSLRTNASNQKTRANRRQIDRPRLFSSPQATTGGIDQTNSTTNQTAAELSPISGGNSQSKQRNEYTTQQSDAKTAGNRPTLKQNRSTVEETRPENQQNVIRPKSSQKNLNQNNRNYLLGGNRRDFLELANVARNMPLEEVAERLGLEPDKHTPNQYKLSQVYTISITEQRFYDHIAQKGGGGAIDLVMHVNDCDFKEAVEWLNDNSINPTPVKQANSSFKQTLHSSHNTQDSKPKPFEPPVPDESKWSAVKSYLVNTRKLPESTIDTLHQKGILYADYKQNAVFIRKNMPGRVTGASLRGTYNGSDFKGLSKGTQRDSGWFSFQKGQGELERIILTESPIDAISAAAIAQKPETTLFISTDGAGSAPIPFLQQKLVDGKQIIVAYDNDEAGNHMAQQVMEKLPDSHRVTPKLGKDWNEQILYSQGTKEQKRQIFRQEYEKFRKVIDNDPKLANKSIKGKDVGVAILIIKTEAEKPSGESLVDRVGTVLIQSDQVRQWKGSMPENEFRAKVKEYLQDTFSEARQIRESILADRQKNQGFELER